MLQLIECQNSQDKSQYLDRLHLQSVSWIVSDLRNKFDLQKFLLKKHGGFEDLSVYRANELWRYMFKRHFPFYQLVSKDFVKAWIRDRLPEMYPDLSIQSDSLLLNLVDELGSIFAHPEGESRLQDWFEKYPESKSRWGQWSQIAQSLFADLLAEEKLPANSLPAFLQYNLPANIAFDRTLYVDLGHHLSKEEAELFVLLSRHVDVYVFSPKAEYLNRYPHVLGAYRMLWQAYAEKEKLKLLTDQMNSFSLEKVHIADSAELKFYKFTNPLGESKQAVTQVRKWLEQGAALEQIAIIAADIEAYWPLLQSLFKTEGIPCNKDLTQRLASFPMTRSWVSQLRAVTGALQFGDLAQLNFSAKQEPRLRYENFYSLFSQFLDVEDLQKNPNLQKSFASSYTANQVLSRDQAIGFLFSYWPDVNQLESLESIFKQLMSQSWAGLSLKLSTWIYLVEQIVQKVEIISERASLRGIQMLNLSMSDSLFASHRIYLGLTESALQPKSINLIQVSEVQSIERELGFYLTHPEQSALQFEFEWQLQSAGQHLLLSTSLSDMQGQIQAPAAVWMKLSSRYEDPADVPELTRYDEILQSSLVVQPEEQQTADLNLTHLSASSIESYAKCPFVFKAEKLFQLLDPALVDLDMDKRYLGIVTHAFLEKLTLDEYYYKSDAEISDEQLAALAEEELKKLEIPSLPEVIVKALKNKYIKMGRRFLSIERQWRAQFPQSKIVAREAEFRMNIHVPDHENAMKLIGKVDRIEADPNQRVVVVDYKSSPVAGNIEKWLKEGKLQLFLYALAVEEGAIKDLPAGEVVGAVYYNLKSMDRKGGIRQTEHSELLLDNKDLKRNKFSSQQKQEIFAQAKQRIEEISKMILDKKFDPVPLDANQCISCNWRGLCRAPHLQ